MILLPSAPVWLAGLLILLLALAAIEDLWKLEISNWLCAAVAGCAFLAVAVDGPVTGIWQNILLFAAVLGVGTLLFAKGWMGGGDIKLLAACSLWFDLQQGWQLLVAVAIAGGLETLLVLLLRLLPWPSSARSRLPVLRRDEGIPYGLAIGVGVLLVGLIAA